MTSINQVGGGGGHDPLLWDWNLHWDWGWLVPPHDHSNDVQINYQQAADGTPVYCQSDGAGS